LSNRKNSATSRAAEAKAAEVLGRQIPVEKQRLLLLVTLLACAMPMVMGLRMWDAIPEMVPTGMIGADGTDESLSRTMVVLGLPGLLCLLDLVAHLTLKWNQKRRTPPPAPSRVIGRWGFPVISVVLCSGVILEALGQELTLSFLTPCVLGLALLWLGAHVWDCRQDAKLALHLSYTHSSTAVWKATHRFAGWLWMLVGLALIADAELSGTFRWYAALLVLAALCLPVLYARNQASKLN